MVDLLKDWNPNKYMVEVENEDGILVKLSKTGEVIIDDKGKEDIEFQMINQLQNNWADNLLSVINKLISFNYNFTQKEIIYLSVTVIIVMVIYFILFSAYQLIKPRYPPPQQFNIKLIQ